MNIDLNPITGLPSGSYDFINDNINPIVLLILVIIIVIYYFIFSSLGKITPNMSEQGKAGIALLDILLWAIFIVLVLINGVAYFYNIDIVASIKNLFTGTPEIKIKAKNMDHSESTQHKAAETDISGITDIESSDTDNIKKITKEVFNVPGNYYTYNDARAICKAFNGRLANYQELEDAYDKGADWCNYGWSQNQFALFPTNLKKWQKLQKITDHKHDCGRPGINGGFIDNPNVKFGVNCYGYKPKITNEEQLLMDEAPLYPKTVKEVNFDKKVNRLKNHLSKIIISPFNNNTWSII